jgi:hypothetical protein
VTDTTLILLAFVAVIGAGITARFSRAAIWALLLWLPIQGWIQINIFNDSNATVLLYEVFIIWLYVVFSVRALRFPKEFAIPRVLLCAVPFVIWCIVLVPFSLAQNGAGLTLIGLRTYLLPLPLVWLGFLAFRRRSELEKVGWAIMVETILVGAVTTAQFAGGVNAKGGVTEVPKGFMIAGTLRPPGTFSAPGQLGMYVLLLVPLGLGLLSLKTAFWKRAGFAAGLVSAAVALVVNSQRATLVLLAVTLPLMVALARRMKALGAILVGIVVLGGGYTLGKQVAGEMFERRVISIVDDAELDLLVVPTERMKDALETPAIGQGLGIASPGVERILLPEGMSPTRPINKPSESFMAALVYQLGIPGLMLFYFIIVMLMLNGWRAVRACRGTDVALLASAILAYQVAICIDSWTYSPLHFPPSRILFWFWAGVLLRLPKLQADYARETLVAPAEWQPLQRRVAAPAYARQLAAAHPWQRSG